MVEDGPKLLFYEASRFQSIDPVKDRKAPKTHHQISVYVPMIVDFGRPLGTRSVYQEKPDYREVSFMASSIPIKIQKILHGITK
jgi:hypothetical protein